MGVISTFQLERTSEGCCECEWGGGEQLLRLKFHKGWDAYKYNYYAQVLISFV